MTFIGGTPRKLELVWTTDGRDTVKRLMSPLIVKPVQLANGKYVPVALWMKRVLPPGAKVIVTGARQTTAAGSVDASEAGFDAMPPGDTAKYAPLRGMASVEEAFFNWVNGQ
jgi:CRISPR-associated protein Cmr1